MHIGQFDYAPHKGTWAGCDTCEEHAQAARLKDQAWAREYVKRNPNAPIAIRRLAGVA